MSTPEEKLRAIYNSMRILKEFRVSLQKKKDDGIISNDELTELNKVNYCISRGERILAEVKQ